MLCLIITHKKLFVGLGGNDIRLLSYQGQGAIPFEGRQVTDVIKEHWTNIVRLYRQQSGRFEEPLKVAVAMDWEQDKQAYIQLEELLTGQQNPPVSLSLIDRLVVSYLHGVENRRQLEGKRIAVLEAIDDMMTINAATFDTISDEVLEEEGAKGILDRESIDQRKLRDIGPAKGHEHLLSDSLRQLREAGFNLDMRGQTELAHQLLNNEGGEIKVKREVGKVKVDATISWDRQQWEMVMASGKEVLGNMISADILRGENIERVYLLGAYFRNRVLNRYLRDTLGLGNMLMGVTGQQEETIFKDILQGLSRRVAMLDEAQTRNKAAVERKLQDEKRAKVEAELKAKDERDALFSEMQNKCVDPNLQETYELEFVPKGERLGIPAVVTKWNISEILNQVSLEKEAQEFGVNKEDEEQADSTPAASAAAIVAPSLQETNQTPPPVEEISPSVTPPSLESDQDPKQEEVPTPPPAMPVAEVEEPEPEPEPTLPLATMEPGDNFTVAAEPLTPKVEDSLPEPIEPSIPTSTPQSLSVAPTPSSSSEPVMAKVVTEPSAKSSANGNGEGLPSSAPVIKPVGKIQALNEVVAPEPKTTNEDPHGHGKPAVATAVAKPDIKPLREKAKPNTKAPKNLVSLDDLFVIQRDLPYGEFTAKLAVFKGQADQKVVRLVPKNKLEEAEERFTKLYEKELGYYEHVSELSHAKEGMFFYRPFFERTTLKEHIIKMGLNKKEQVDDLSSNDLKFILQVFKEVRALAYPHADLNGDNILVLTKRKWGLQKNVEIKFVGFTSEDITNDEMIEATHKAFAATMGENFYQAFREKFQL